MTKIILFYLFLVFYSSGVSAGTIYQWRDEWGQLQYSKEPVPGAMVSDLTELPEAQETTEQQKQEAMFRKMQEMRQFDLLRKKNKLIEDDMKQQQLNMRNYCAQLRDTLMDLQLSNARRRAFSGYNFFIPNSNFSFLENDVSRAMHKDCR